MRAMPKLIVGSVFTSGAQTERWLSLQMKFLRQTTEDFVHAVFLAGDVRREMFAESEIIGTHPVDKVSAPGCEQSGNHAIGLAALLSYFRATRADNYLVLDSDCFPIMPWQEHLLRKMGAKRIAAAIRTENLDVFPHPCAIFIRGAAIHEPWMELGMGRNVNLLGHPIDDNGCSLPMAECYPLIKSNVHSPHPFFGTVYNHMFYHHACGSRNLMPRSVLSGYFDHYLTDEDHERAKQAMYRQLCADPDRYIDGLLGRGSTFGFPNERA